MTPVLPPVNEEESFVEDSLDPMEAQEPQEPTMEMMDIPEEEVDEIPETPETQKLAIGSTAEELTDDEKTALLYIYQRLTQPDDEVRQRLVPVWQMYENYWRGLQDVVYDPGTQTFLTAAGVLKQAQELEDTYIGSKIANIYKAHGESIAAAISVGNPSVVFYPEDADDPRDITTAKTYTVASQFVADDNDSKLIHLRALYTRWNQPFVAYYNTYVYDEELGSIQRKTYSLQEEETPAAFCPECMDDLPVQTPNSICPDCGVEAINHTVANVIPVVDSVVEVPRGKETIEVYGPRNVRVPFNVKNLKQCPYLILETEHHWTALAEVFPSQMENRSEGSPAGGGYEDESRRARRAIEGAEPDRDQLTLFRCWFRKSSFNMVSKEDVRMSLRTKFPNGVQVSILENEVLEAYNESMDDHWTLLPDPYAEHIHGDPLGKIMIPIQDMTNDTLQLTEETILFSIPELFADPTVLNFVEYNKAEKTPGLTYPAKKPSGQNLDAGFFQSRATQLSDNVEVFRRALEGLGQFLTGDFPGIHGGALPAGSSRTADEYRQSKQSALQRLSILWVMVNQAWSEVMNKAVKELRRHMIFQGEDIKFVEAKGKGFVNVWIKLSDMDQGKVGRVRPESTEQFPMSTEQKRGVIMELLQTQVPSVTEALMSPDNMGEIFRIMANLTNFRVPGEEDREYQLWEIKQMMDGMPAEVNPDADNNDIHLAVTRSWVASEDGRYAREHNPEGYTLVLQHMQQHLFIQQQQQMQMMQAQAGINPAATPGPRGKPGRAQATGATAPGPEGVQ